MWLNKTPLDYLINSVIYSKIKPKQNISRKSLLYSDNKCKNNTKKGNDGKLYKSATNQINIYRCVIQ